MSRNFRYLHVTWDGDITSLGWFSHSLDGVASSHTKAAFLKEHLTLPMTELSQADEVLRGGCMLSLTPAPSPVWKCAG